MRPMIFDVLWVTTMPRSQRKIMGAHASKNIASTAQTFPPLQRNSQFLKSLQQYVRMMPLENQHWPEPHRRSTTSTNVNPQCLRLRQELVSLRMIECDECASSLAPQVLEFIG